MLQRKLGQFVWNLLPEVVSLKHIIVSSADLFRFTVQEFSMVYTYMENLKKPQNCENWGCSFQQIWALAHENIVHVRSAYA